MNSLATVLLRLAGQFMPADRKHWFDAMRSESHYLPAGERLRWSFGCLLTALKQRFAPMETGSFRISRGVMFVEALGAFGPLTLGWWEVTFGASGLVRYSPEVIDKVFMHNPGGAYIFSMTIVGAILGLLGPIGLFFGLRYVLSGRGITNRSLGWTLIVVPIAAHVFGTAAGYIAGPPDFEYSAFGFWFYTVMLTAVPVAVIYHLMVLARPSTHASAPLVAAA